MSFIVPGPCDVPAAWFAMLERAVAAGDRDREREARRNLARFGVRVTFGQPVEPAPRIVRGSNGVGGIAIDSRDPFHSAKPNPLPKIYDRLIPLVTSNIEWWRTAVRRWASRKNPLTIPLLYGTPDEQISLLAAIYDYHAAPAGQIDPWNGPSEMPADLSEDGPISGLDSYFQALDEGLATYHQLVEQVPLLPRKWDINGRIIEYAITDVKKMLSRENKAMKRKRMVS